MKRSKSINLIAMRKIEAGREQKAGLHSNKVKPLGVAIVASVAVTGCSNDVQEAEVYRSIEDCNLGNPGQEEACQMAFENSEKEAERTAPKYNLRRDCEDEFGYDRCRRQSSSGVFMPMMAGFMLGRMTGGSPTRCGMVTPYSYRYDYCRSSPVFTSYSRRSPYYGNWISADGRDYGSRYNSSVRASSKSFDKKPTVTKTISRGGFGSKAAAKSSWSGSRSSGWGG